MANKAVAYSRLPTQASLFFWMSRNGHLHCMDIGVRREIHLHDDDNNDNNNNNYYNYNYYYYYPHNYIIIIIMRIIVSFIQGSYTHIPETNHVPRGYIVTAILCLLFMVPLCLVPA